MAEQFLTLMADLDDEAQARMSAWYRSLQEAGFTGVQTPGLPYHISLSSFPPDQEKEAAEIARKQRRNMRLYRCILAISACLPEGRCSLPARKKTRN